MASPRPTCSILKGPAPARAPLAGTTIKALPALLEHYKSLQVQSSTKTPVTDLKSLTQDLSRTFHSQSQELLAYLTDQLATLHATPAPHAKLPSLDLIMQLDYQVEHSHQDNMAQLDALEEYLTQQVEEDFKARISSLEREVDE